MKKGDEISTPLGRMTVYPDGDSIFLEKVHTDPSGREIKISVQVDGVDSIPSARFLFISSILDSLEKHLGAAVEYLRDTCNSHPEEFGFDPHSFVRLDDSRKIAGRPDLMFWEKENWGIIFRDNVFPSSQEIGISVEFDGREIIDYNTLEDLE